MYLTPITALAAATVVAIAGIAHADTLYLDNLVVTNTVAQTAPVSTNYFLGKVGIGTNKPSAQLHVAGEMKVDGAITLPRQGDVEMGIYTNGASTNGASPGYLPAGTQGAMLYHNGTNWTALTNLYWSAANNRLYFNSSASGTCVDTTTGNLILGGNINLGGGGITNGYGSLTGRLSAASYNATTTNGYSLNGNSGSLYFIRQKTTAGYDIYNSLKVTNAYTTLSLTNYGVPPTAKGVVVDMWVWSTSNIGYTVAIKKTGMTNGWNYSGGFGTIAKVVNTWTHDEGSCQLGTNACVDYTIMPGGEYVMNIKGWYE